MLFRSDSKVICFDSECGFWSIALLQYMSLSKSSKATHGSWRPSKNSLEVAVGITESKVTLRFPSLNKVEIGQK